MRMIRGAVPFVFVTTVSSMPVAATAATPGEICAGAKLKASGRYVAALLTCVAKATKVGGNVDGTCAGKATTRLTAALAKADARGGCVPGGNLSSIAVSDTDPIVFLLRPVTTANGCASSKFKAAGRKAKTKLACHAKATARGLTVDPTCLVKAEARFAADFARAETRPPCLTTGDVAGIESLVDDLVADLVTAIPAVPPTTTSTTTSTTTTAPACTDPPDCTSEPCCAPAVCTVICAPGFPHQCRVPFAGTCNMTGTWLPFFSSFGYSIVEGANGALDVVAFDGMGTDFWPTAGTRSGVAVSIGTAGDPFQFSGTLTSCDTMEGSSDVCALLQRFSTETCGDGVLQSARGEQCDDGNHVAGDCCSPICQVEPGCP